MDWKDEDVAAAYDSLPNHDDTYAECCKAVRAIMTRAVELAAARGGTMTAGVVRFELERITQCISSLASDAWREHIAALGARNAVLEAQLTTAQHEVAQMDAAIRVMVPDIEASMSSTCVWCGTPAPTPVTTDTLRAHVAGHVKVCEKHPMRALEERLSAAEEGNRELVSRAQQAESDLEREKANTRVWLKRCTDAADVLADVLPGQCGTLDLVTKVKHLKERCATLSDAGHGAHVDEDPAPEYANGICGPRPVDSSVICVLPKGHLGDHWDGTDVETIRYPCSPTCTHDDAATPGHPERVKERSEAVNEAVDVPADHDWGEREPDPYQRGAEAMRAACLEAAQRVGQTLGLGPTEMEMFKSAIEGAVP